MRPEFGIHKIRITEVFLTLGYMGKLQPVRMMFGVSSIFPNINTERVKGIL